MCKNSAFSCNQQQFVNFFSEGHRFGAIVSQPYLEKRENSLKSAYNLKPLFICTSLNLNVLVVFEKNYSKMAHISGFFAKFVPE